MSTPLLTIVLYFFQPILPATSKQTQATQSSSPNIIFILADDLGWDDVDYTSSNSPNIGATPNIDRLAETGRAPSRKQLMRLSVVGHLHALDVHRAQTDLTLCPFAMHSYPSLFDDREISNPFRNARWGNRI